MNLRSQPKLVLIPIIVMLIVALYPQISLWLTRGKDWAGSYAASNYDEVAYSAYVNALINGKPRKYDPMMGVEHKHESIFSLQLIPAYAVAMPARIFGISASTAFIILQILIAVFSSLAIFFFIRLLIGDDLVSAAGVLVVLCLGTTATYEGSLRDMVDGGLIIEYLPFLRRYQPGFAFPLFFLMAAAVWGALNSEGKRRALFSTTSGIIFAVLVFSYFYLWTAAAVWLACLFATAFALRKEMLKDTVVSALSVGAVAVIALVPYLLLLGQRSRNSDEVQLLTLTHAPDLTAPTIIIGLGTIAAAVVLGWLGKIDARSSQAVFAYAFALVPLFVLNQQVITGRSLQPVHYEIFIANYSVLAGAVIIAGLAVSGKRGEKSTGIGRSVFAAVGIFAALWGVQEARHAVGRNTGMMVVRDAVYPAAAFIREQIAGSDETFTVHTPNPIAGSFIPTVATVRVLWNPHLVAGGSISEAENKEQFYRFIYYSGFAPEDLENALNTRWFEMTAAVFGGGRALPQLGGANHPITDEDIKEEVAKYNAFIENIDASTAYSPQLAFVVVHAGEEPNFANLDRWYTRDNGHVAGLFKVYRLTPNNH